MNDTTARLVATLALTQDRKLPELYSAQIAGIDRLFDAMFAPVAKPWIFYTRDASCGKYVADAGPYIEHARFATEDEAKAFGENYIRSAGPVWPIVAHEDDENEIQIYSDGEWKETTESACEAD